MKLRHPDGKVGDAPIMLADEFPEINFRSPQSIGGTSVNILIYVNDVDALVDKATAAGAKLVRPVEDQPYGARVGVKATAERTSKQGIVGLEIMPFLRGPLSYLLESAINFDCLSMLNSTKTKNLIEGFKKGSNVQWELVWRLVSLNYWLSVN